MDPKKDPNADVPQDPEQAGKDKIDREQPKAR